MANPSFCIDVSGYRQTKLDAVRAYDTQFVQANANVVDWIDASMTYFGSRIGSEAAEPFFTKEPLALGSLDSLLI